jgi:hypothetical protein
MVGQGRIQVTVPRFTSPGEAQLLVSLLVTYTSQSALNEFVTLLGMFVYGLEKFVQKYPLTE